tara:strand:+ start:1159 stop:1437 length:279 start_codon:yes stop_codon:yes gene_type:complete
MVTDMRHDMTEGEALVWLMNNHMMGAIILMRTILKQELLSLDYLEKIVLEYAGSADDVWEEELWTKFTDILHNEPKLAPVLSPDPAIWTRDS